eukprot:9514565-Prorocentrum_lima.AAC.1
MDLFCSTALAHMSSVLWDMEYPMHVWDAATSCCAPLLMKKSWRLARSSSTYLQSWRIGTPVGLDGTWVSKWKSSTTEIS